MFRSFFNRKSEPELPGVYKVDLHSHLIPGIDDGVQTGDEALEIIRALSERGVEKCITTPHVMQDAYDNDRNKILAGLHSLQELLHQYSIRMQVQAAAEYYADEFFLTLIEQKDLMTFGDNFVLFELPMNVRPNNAEQFVFNLITNGYKPVLAHPERYMYFHDRKFADYQKLKNMGAYFQVNAGSLTGYYKIQIREVAQRMIDEDIVEFAGSDIHRFRHVENLDIALRNQHFRKLLVSEKFLNNSI